VWVQVTALKEPRIKVIEELIENANLLWFAQT